MRTLSSILFAALLLPALADAQLTLNLTGRIEVGPANKCNPQATHRVTCGNVELFSSAVDLTAFEGKVAYLEGKPAIRLGCPLGLEVEKAETSQFSTADFSLGGYRLRDTVIFTTAAPIGSLVLHFFAEKPGFLPVPLANVGSLLLDAGSLVFWKSSVSIGLSITTLQIPDVASLIGTSVLYQTAFLRVSPGGGRFLNAGCFTIKKR